MKNAISSEFIKLRRSWALILAAAAAFLPPAVEFARSISGHSDRPEWLAFLSSRQELAVSGMIIMVMLLAAWIFTMEYQHGTAGALFITGVKRIEIFTAKMVALSAVITGLLILSAASQLLFGALAVGKPLPAPVFWQFVSVTVWYVFSYIMLAAVVVLPAVLTKRFVLTAVITLGYYILIFPFHTKNAYVCPFMTPTIVAAKLYGSDNYIFGSSYDNLTTGVLPAGAVLACLAAAALAAGAVIYRKSDAVR